MTDTPTADQLREIAEELIFDHVEVEFLSIAEHLYNHGTDATETAQTGADRG